MDVHIRKVYVPMTETGFYILLCLREESHGYNIIRKVEELTDGEIRISPGTMYGSVQDGKRWADPFCAGKRKPENLPYYRPGKRCSGTGNEADRAVVPEYDGGALK